MRLSAGILAADAQGFGIGSNCWQSVVKTRCLMGFNSLSYLAHTPSLRSHLIQCSARLIHPVRLHQGSHDFP